MSDLLDFVSVYGRAQGLSRTGFGVALNRDQNLLAQHRNMTAVVVDGADGKEYRLPTDDELRMAAAAQSELDALFTEIPFGLPEEPLPSKEALGFRVPLYGFDRWSKLFTPRQLLALGTFVKHARSSRAAMGAEGYPADWIEATQAYLAAGFDRLLDRSSTLCQPDPTPAQSGVLHTFHRFALPMVWDFIGVSRSRRLAAAFTPPWNGSRRLQSTPRMLRRGRQVLRS
jgi:adenine-specific DNA methylase